MDRPPLSSFFFLFLTLFFCGLIFTLRNIFSTPICLLYKQSKTKQSKASNASFVRYFFVLTEAVFQKHFSSEAAVFVFVFPHLFSLLFIWRKVATGRILADKHFTSSWCLECVVNGVAFVYQALFKVNGTKVKRRLVRHHFHTDSAHFSFCRPCFRVNVQ